MEFINFVCDFLVRDMYPINLKLTGRPCAVVGGGQVAWRKIDRLLDCGARVTVISPEVDSRIEAMAKAKKLIWRKGAYSRGGLEGFFCVFCATNDPKINRMAALEGKQAGALINVASDPELCDFTLPGVVRQGPLLFTVSSDGASPGFTRLLRQDLEKRYHTGFGEFALFLREIRRELIKKFSSSCKREAVWQGILTDNIVKVILDKDLDGAKNEIRNGINRFGTEPSDGSR